MNILKASMALQWIGRMIHDFGNSIKGKWEEGFVGEAKEEGEIKWVIDYVIDTKLKDFFSEASKKLDFSANVLLEEQEKSFSVVHGVVKDQLLDSETTFFLDPICYSTDYSRWLLVKNSPFPTRAFFIGGWTDIPYQKATLVDIKVGIHYSLGTGEYILGIMQGQKNFLTLMNGTVYELPDFKLIKKPIIAFPCYSNAGYDIIGALMKKLVRKYKVFMGTGGTALDQELVFEGRIDGMADLRALVSKNKGASLKPHDIAAVYPISMGLNLRISKGTGDPIDARIFEEEPIDIVLARNEIFDQLIKDIKHLV